MGDGGYLDLGPGTPPWVRGSIYKKKILHDLGSKFTHSGHRTQRSFDPPPPPPPKKVGVTGVKIQKIIGRSFLILK